MKIHIKNMVCDRCSLAVENIIQSIGLKYTSIALGEINFSDYYGEVLPHTDEALLSCELEKLGFSILSDKKSKIVESIKTSCIEYIENIESLKNIVLSEHIRRALHLEYNYVSHLFSVVEGITIEQYFIRLRVEKVKELLMYEQLSLGEIAFQLGFSSTAHLSGQFKKLTGLTASHFRELKNQKLRTPLDKL